MARTKHWIHLARALAALTTLALASGVAQATTLTLAVTCGTGGCVVGADDVAAAVGATEVGVRLCRPELAATSGAPPVITVRLRRRTTPESVETIIQAAQATRPAGETCWTVTSRPLATALGAADSLAVSVHAPATLQPPLTPELDAATLPWRGPVTCATGPSPEELNAGADRVANALGQAAPANLGAARAAHWGETGDHGSFYVIAIGPSGHRVGPMPPVVTESRDVFVVVYARPDASYDLRVSGCAAVPVRVSGSVAASTAEGMRLAPGDGPPPVALVPTVTRIGRCSADQLVTITTVVPAQGAYCAANEVPTTLQTEAVYRIQVGIGALFSVGPYNVVGVTPGAGGQPGQVFSRSEDVEFRTAVSIVVYPAGIPARGEPPLLARFGFGVATSFAPLPTDIQVFLAFTPVRGLDVLVGNRFARVERRLGAGLANGGTFNDDSATLPTSDQLAWSPAFTLGVAVNQDLFRSIFGAR